MGKVVQLTMPSRAWAVQSPSQIFSKKNDNTPFIEHPWFSDLLKVSQTKTYEAGTIINAQGEMSEHIGFILSGRTTAISYAKNGSTTWLGQLTTGEFFGSASYFSQSPLDFYITAETELTALIVPAHNIPALLSSNTRFSEVFVRDLASKFCRMQRLMELQNSSAKNRIYAELMRLAAPRKNNPDQLSIRPNPKLVDFAQRVNATRETVSRTINALQKNGTISRQPGMLIIHNQRKLSALAQ